MNMSDHFALIPVGILPVGAYHVKMIRGPDQGDDWAFTNPIKSERAHILVCKSFQFEVVPNK